MAVYRRSCDHLSFLCRALILSSLVAFIWCALCENERVFKTNPMPQNKFVLNAIFYECLRTRSRKQRNMGAIRIIRQVALFECTGKHAAGEPRAQDAHHGHERAACVWRVREQLKSLP